MTNRVVGVVSSGDCGSVTVAGILTIKSDAKIIPADYVTRLCVAGMFNPFLELSVDPETTTHPSWSRVLPSSNLTMEEIRNSLERWGDTVASTMWKALMDSVLEYYASKFYLTVVGEIRQPWQAEAVRQIGGTIVRIASPTYTPPIPVYPADVLITGVGQAELEAGVDQILNYTART